MSAVLLAAARRAALALPPRSRCFASSRDPLAALFAARTSSLLEPATQALLEGLLRGDRVSLARSITLVESTRQDHRLQAGLLLDEVLRSRHLLASHPAGVMRTGAAAVPGPATQSPSASGTARGTFRVGIAGPPGAGKSSLIEVLGMYLVGQGHRVAVIAVDPSSSRTGGSILGDKTRMPLLSVHPSAYVRPAPTSGALGGVAEHTNDVVLLCEGAGFDTVLVETVGLGQSEVAIATTTDMVLLVVPPAGGDELQGVKKGIVEVADTILVNKSDGALVPAARNAEAEYRRALQLVRPKHSMWMPRVVRCSALAAVDGTTPATQVHDVGGAASIADVWAVCEAFREALGGAAGLASRRRAQGEAWMWAGFNADLAAAARSNPTVQQRARELVELLGDGHVAPRAATRALLRTFGAACAEAAADAKNRDQ